MAEVHDVISVSTNKKNVGVSTSSRLYHGECCQNREIKELLCVSPECLDPQYSCTFIPDSRYMFGINTDT